MRNSDAKTFLEIHIERWTRKQSRGLLKKFLELFSCQSLILVYLKFEFDPGRYRFSWYLQSWLTLKE